MPDTLLLRLEGVQMSFGGVRVNDTGPTDRWPFLSQITGLIGAPLGYERGADDDRLERLQSAISFAVRCDRAGVVERDFRVSRVANLRVPDGPPLYEWHPEVRRGGVRETIVHPDEYIAGACYTIALRLRQIDGVPSHDEVAEALRFPVFPPFLGRKAFRPSSDIYLGRTDAPRLRDALALPEFALAAGRYRAVWPIEEGRDEVIQVHRRSEHRSWTNNVHIGRRNTYEGCISVRGTPQPAPSPTVYKAPRRSTSFFQRLEAKNSREVATRTGTSASPVATIAPVDSSVPLHLIRFELDMQKVAAFAKQRLGVTGDPFQDLRYLVHQALEVHGLGWGRTVRPFFIDPRAFGLRSPKFVAVSAYSTKDRETLERDLALSSSIDQQRVEMLSPNTLSSKPLPARWMPGERLRFSVVALPVVRTLGVTGKEGIESVAHASRRQDPHLSEVRAFQLWLEQKLTPCAKVLESQVTGDYVFIPKLSNTLPVVTFTGSLQVTDPEAFRSTLQSGVSRRHTWLGFGMLQLSPAD